jgi:predicted lipoprotein
MSKIDLKKITSISILFTVLIVFLMNCDGNSLSKIDSEIGYLREVQLDNVYTNEIIPLTNNFISKTAALNSLIKSFHQSASIEKLSAIQFQWKEVITVWKRLELYNLGTVEDSFIHFEINRWPTNIDFINTYINGREILNETFMASKGSSSKGISAIEYLLFSSQNNQNVLYEFTKNTNFERRLGYLLALSNNLKSKSEEIYTIWTNDKVRFLSAVENGINGGQNQLINAMITLIEEIIISKLGKPLGEYEDGRIVFEELEAYRSQTSLLIIQEHLTALKRCYTGSFLQNGIKCGFDNYLKLIDREDFDDRIIGAFKNCQNKIDAITTTLQQELVDNPENITNLQNAFRALLVLIRVDMATAIGATVTLNDTDGD